MVTYSRRTLLQGLVTFSLSVELFRLVQPLGAAAYAQADRESRPYLMLVLGDSVVWGQGLKEENKFYSKVKNAIQQGLPANREVQQLVEAHSGATISPKKPKPCPIQPGEVPIATPTLFAQVDAALSTYASFGVKRDEVDLVLLNGGINDVGFPLIINPFTSEKKITKESEKFCKQGMQELLSYIRERFPNAAVVVTGFLPIISLKTKEDLLIQLIRAFFGGDESRKILDKAAKEQQRELREAAKLRQVAVTQPNWLTRRLSQLSDHWKLMSDTHLQAAVDVVNKDKPPKVFFVKVDFLPEECYAADRTKFWQITGSGGGVGNLISDDEMFDPRQETCRLAAPDLSSFGKLKCPVAGTGHPNKEGAQKYADAIIQKLRKGSIIGPPVR